MKTFAEMLNDPSRPFTRDMRDAVEMYVAHEDRRLCDKYGYQMEGGLKLMRSTPPAKEPVSVEACVEKATGYSDHCEIRLQVVSKFNVSPGDRVRVVKIEEPT